jgi:leucyl-tRNA synthetase
MPWCQNCEQMVPDEEMTDDGTCPRCDTPLEAERHIPWHFRLLAFATVVYLGYRAYQGIAWLVHHL